MGRYDTMQVCLNGHKITDRYIEYPNKRQNACEKCGAETIHSCPECGTDIRGKLMNGWPGGEGPDVPDHCRECGEAFEWADDSEEFSDVDSSVLDQELADRVIPEYEDGHYQSAVQSAFIILEERIREWGGFGRDIHGDDLMTEAFSPDDGPLSFGETGGEKQGVMFLYRGAMLSLRNPASHRFIDEVDKDYARDAIHTVNLLLRLMEKNTSEDSTEDLSQIPETGS